MKRYLLVVMAIFLSLSALGAEGSSEPSPASPTVMATTSWTAGFTRLAGVDKVALLAPYEMKHPSEYELKPSDIQALSTAEMIVFAGYENMVAKIKDNAGQKETQLIQIQTMMNYPVMEESVLKIAAAAGTEETARKNLARMKEELETGRSKLKAKGLSGAKAIVHFHQQAFAKEMGFEVVALFGPAPLEAGQIGDLSKVEADLIIDNWHNPVSQPLVEVRPELPQAILINFPGKDDTRDLFDVVRYNLDALLE